MNLTNEQRQLLTQIVDVYLKGCRSPFILAETMEGACLVYSGFPNVAVDAGKIDMMRLAAEGYVDCGPTSHGDLRGKPTANGIDLVQRGFAEAAVLPIEPDSISVSRFRNVIASDFESEEAVESLVGILYEDPDVEAYYFRVAGTPENEFIKAWTDRGDVLKVRTDKYYYVHPKSERDFICIPQARYGDFEFDWQREVVERGPEYVRIRLKLSESKRIEMGVLHRIRVEQAIRERQIREQNAVDVFLSYSSTDQAEADRICASIRSAGRTVFLAKKSLAAGDDFAERIREALLAAGQVWLLLSPASLKSEWVLTEWGAAWVLKKTIVPILHRCRPEDLPTRLARLQCADLYRVDELVKERFPEGVVNGDPVSQSS